MPIENVDCPLIAEIDCVLTTPLLTLAGVNMFDIFFTNGGTQIGKSSNDGTVNRIWRSDSVSSYTLLYSSAGAAFNPVFTQTNGLTWRVTDLTDDGTDFVFAESYIISVPANAGVVIDPAPAAFAVFPINPPIATFGPGAYIFDLDGNPIIPGLSGQSIIMRELATMNFALLTLDLDTNEAVPVSAFTAVDVDELDITDDIQSYSDGQYSYIFYPYYLASEDDNLYPRVKKIITGAFGGAPTYDVTLEIKLAELSDREQAAWGWQMPCQGTGLFGMSGRWFDAPLAGPFYVYAIRYDGSGYYRLNVSGDAQLMADLQADTNVRFIIHDDGFYCFQDVGGAGNTMNVYSFPFPVEVPTYPIYQPIVLPCHPNCVPLFDRRKFA
jgi:hypothetical protein